MCFTERKGILERESENFTKKLKEFSKENLRKVAVWGSFLAKFNWFFKAWFEYLLAWIRGRQLHIVIFHINMCYYVIIG